MRIAHDQKQMQAFDNLEALLAAGCASETKKAIEAMKANKDAKDAFKYQAALVAALKKEKGNAANKALIATAIMYADCYAKKSI